MVTWLGWSRGHRALAFLRTLGARHFIFLPATAGADQRPVLDRLFAEVVPALRDHANQS
jgi:hypothetical protein